MSDDTERDQGVTGGPAGSDYASRKARVTPRQLWANRDRPEDAEQPRADARAQSTERSQPINKPGPLMEITDISELVQAAAESREVERTPAQPPQAETTSPLEQAPEASDASDQIAAAADDAELLDSILEEPEDKPEPMMVNADRQPGSMQYPFATHGPVPGEGEDDPVTVAAAEERRVSSSFVLGALIIAAALLVGLALAGQRSRIAELEQRVAELEQAPRAASGPPVVNTVRR